MRCAATSRSCICERAVRRTASSSSPRRAVSRGASTTTATGASAGFRKLAPACGLSSRPYDLRHSFASLRIQEGRLTIVELAEQLGHSPAMTLRTYAHVIAEFRGGGQVAPDALIAEARAAVPGHERVASGPQKVPTTKKAGVGAGPDQAELPIAIGEPSVGLEPTTPSLPWKCSTN